MHACDISVLKKCITVCVHEWITSWTSSPSFLSPTPPPSVTASQSWENDVYQDPEAHKSISGGGVGRWGEPRGQNTVCAVPGPLHDYVARAQTNHCSSSSFPFIHPPSNAALVPGRAMGWPSDFKDIDRHSSIVKSLIIHLTSCAGHPAPPCMPSPELMALEVC